MVDDAKLVAQQLRDLNAASQCFKVKGGGQVIALFGILTDAWMQVEDVRLYLLNRGVCVDRKTVRKALNQLCQMGILEMAEGAGAVNAAGRYRRKLTDAARSLRERQAAAAQRRQYGNGRMRERLRAA